MATDSHDSHRKHCRSPSEDDDSPETSKRLKHRHHHRRHHRRSKKHSDELKKNEEIPITTSIVPSTTTDYDMEEGEIVEDEGVPIVVDKKVDSDVESGEFRDFEIRTDFDPLHTMCDNGSKKHATQSLDDEPSIGNGDSDWRTSKSESISHTKHKSLSKESIRSKKNLDLVKMDKDEDDKRDSSSYKLSENSHKALTGSPDRRREREHSDKHPRRQHRHKSDERSYGNGVVHDGLDVERESRRSTDYSYDSSSKAKDRRERSLSVHRTSMHGGKDERADYWDREREMDKDRQRVKEHVRIRERGERDNDHYRVLENERNGSGGKDRDRDKEVDRDTARIRDSKSDVDHRTEWDVERRRDKHRDRSRDRNFDREQRDNTIPRYRDRNMEREWDDKLADKDRKLEMDRGRDRNSVRDRHMDRNRDVERDRHRRYHRYDDRDDGYSSRDRHLGYEESKYRKDRDRKHDLGKKRGPKDDSPAENRDGIHGDDDDPKDYQERVDLELAGQEEDDAEKIKERSRRLREAILQKHKAKQSQHETVSQSDKASSEEREEQPSMTDVGKVNVHENIQNKSNGQDLSAVEASFDIGKSPSISDVTSKNSGVGGLGEGTPKSERSNDMFCDDIFGESPAGVRKMGKGDGLPVERSGLHDNWDDPEGYYSFRFGEVLDSRYEITAAHGKGVFSTVVRAKDLKASAGDPEEVAIKIIRNNETMLKAGTEELVILKKLVGADQDDRRHCVRYLSHFKYRNHLCIVFESLHMNLREVLKKFGRNIGLKLTAVRAYAKQLFIALKHLKNCGVLHSDIKPDNMLVNDAKNVLKLCDFGNAMFAGKNEVTPYLVSRFYRAPEIILGLPYDHPMDIWSVGCCLYELYTGKVLFPGSTNNDMLRLHMELKGPFPKKMLRKGAFVEKHFDSNLNFLAIEEDPVSKKPIRRAMVNIKPKDVGSIIKGSPGEDPKMLANFKDLLDKIFALDPEKRLTVSQALNHPFITGK